MKKAIKITGNIFSYSLFILLLITVFAMVYSKTHPQKIFELYGYKLMPVLSGSMEPVIKTGDIAVVENVAPEEVNQGDIITYKDSRENRYITHRVVNIQDIGEKVQFITKGDANNDADITPVEESQLSGRYITRIPYGGFISSFVKTPRGYILLILLPIAVLMVLEIITILSEARKLKIKENTASRNDVSQ